METNEHSWHGFPRIVLPNDKEHLSRRSLALYFYTKERPQEEIRGGHGTFYIQRPLPGSFCVGTTLTKEIFEEVNYLVSKRDAFLRLYQETEIDNSRQFAALESNYNFVLSKLRAPVLGWAKQNSSLKGYYADDWIGQQFSGSFVAQIPLKSVSVRFYVPEHIQFPTEFRLSANGATTEKIIESAGPAEINIGVSIPKEDKIDLVFSASDTFSPAKAGINDDSRSLAASLSEIIFE